MWLEWSKVSWLVSGKAGAQIPFPHFPVQHPFQTFCLKDCQMHEKIKLHFLSLYHAGMKEKSDLNPRQTADPGAQTEKS